MRWAERPRSNADWAGEARAAQLDNMSPLPALRTAETHQATVRLQQVPPGHTGSSRAPENRPAVHSAARCPAEPLSTPNALSSSFISCPRDRGGHMAPYDIGFSPGAVLPSYGDRWHRQSPASGRLSDASLFLKTFSCESSSTPGRSRGPRPTRRPRGLPLEPRLLLRGVTPTALPRGSSR